MKFIEFQKKQNKKNTIILIKGSKLSRLVGII